MELGSEFNLNFQDMEKKEDNIFYYLKEYCCIYTDSGRSALRILKDIIPKKGKILLPSYICDSVIDCFEEDRVGYYNLNFNLEIIWQELDYVLEQDVAAIFIMHYFGKIQEENILNKIKEKCKRYNILIIEDTTHSIFSRVNTIGDYCICSLRKWFAIPDGGVLYSLRKLPEVNSLGKPKWSIDKTQGMFLKTLFLEKGYDCNLWYRELFAEAEDKLDKQKEICGISEMAFVLLSRYSVFDMIKKRRANYEKLEIVLRNYGISFLKEMPECPFVFPVILNNRNGFRKYLIEQQIYCAVHWPVTKVYLEKKKIVNYIAKHIMSLPIDQRYETEHIMYLAEKLLSELEC